MLMPAQESQAASLTGPDVVVAWRLEVLQKVFTYMFALMGAILLVETALSLRSGAWHALPALSLAVLFQGIAAFARGLSVRARAATFTAAAFTGVGMSLPVLGFSFPVPFIVAGLTLTLLALCVSQRFALVALGGLVLVILAAGLAVCFSRRAPLPAPLAQDQQILDPNHFSNWIRVTLIFAAVNLALIGSVGFLVRRLTEAVSHNAGLFSSLEQESRDKIRALEEREVLRDKVKRSDELHLLGLLSATVAHDFNNLLMVILGNAAALRSTVRDQAKEDLVEIERACERAADLCRSLLTLAGERISGDEVAELNRLVEDELPLLRRLVTSRVTVEWAPGPPLWLKFARKEMRQALLNLCANARDAMPKGGRLRIATARVERSRPETAPAAATAHACLSIGDDGFGMDAATRDRIFEPFFTTKGKTKGTGLGMTVVSAAVERQSGFLELETAPGRGTTFSLFFPLVDRPVDAAAPSDRPARPSRRLTPLGTETVLVVDDDEGSRRMLARYLQRHHYTVLTATDGQDALEVLAGGPKVDLVISDAAMPRMGGQALLDALSKERPSLPFLFCSGYADGTVPGDIVDAPSRALLVKPFSEEALLREVRRLLGTTTPPA
jgi:signal transduction histidine kinase/CheY-like chemotaxis protein